MNDMNLENTIKQLAESIGELTIRIKQISKYIEGEENEMLKLYADNSTPLELMLATGGIIRGKISWVGNHSLGIKAESGQNYVLYKHSIALIQEI